MTLKLHCPGTWNYFLLKNQTLENIRPFHLGTGWKHQNWLLKMWHFLNLVFILLGMLIGWEMDTFCILSEHALNHQWNFDFVHSSTACILLLKGGTRPGWKATLRGLAVTSLFQGGGARKNNRSRRDLAAAVPISSHGHWNTFHAFLCHMPFFVTRVSCYLPGLLPGEGTHSTGQSCSLLHVSLIWQVFEPLS